MNALPVIASLTTTPPEWTNLARRSSRHVPGGKAPVRVDGGRHGDGESGGGIRCGRLWNVSGG
jgi:hypothetical protein